MGVKQKGVKKIAAKQPEDNRDAGSVAKKKAKFVAAVSQSKPASSSDLDSLIHERTRLGMVSALASHSCMSFSELKSLMQISDGNLSTHARKLEEAGYIECSKSFDGRMPRTEYKLKPRGREALQRYVAHMEALIAAMKV